MYFLKLEGVDKDIMPALLLIIYKCRTLAIDKLDINVFSHINSLSTKIQKAFDSQSVFNDLHHFLNEKCLFDHCGSF